MTTTTQAGTVPRKKLSPRKRAQRIRWIQYAILAAVVVLLILNVDGRQVQSVFFRTDLIQVTLTSGLPRALLNTVFYTFGAFVVGVTLGTLLALMRLSQVAPYRWIESIYIEFFRGVPALIVLLAFGLLALSHTQAIAGFGLVLSVGVFASFLLAPLAMPYQGSAASPGRGDQL